MIYKIPYESEAREKIYLEFPDLQSRSPAATLVLL